jgi:ribosomal protein S18 acetylase RimI-like enzyme
MQPLYAKLLEDPPVTAYVAQDGQGNPLGYVIARVITRPETVLSWGATVVDIDQIGVTSSARRQGVGARLMSVVRSLAEEVDADLLHLTVWDFNQPAKAFFRSQGLNLTMLRMTDP